MKGPFKLVSFDVMGTLLKTAQPMGEIYSRVGKLHGIRSDPNHVYHNFKRGWALMNREHPNYGLNTGITWAEWWRKLVIMSLDNAPGSGGAADELIELFGTAEGWHPIDGALAVLDNLKAEGVCLGVISNFDPRLDRILQALGMGNYFEFVTASYNAGAVKPDPAIFKYSEKLYCEATGDNLDKQCALHVGDSPELDYNGALSAGWNAALVNSSKPACYQRVFRDLYELKAYFKSIYKIT